ncbi:hypothetical protein [Microbacterium aurantiacum]|uniref:Uncharacterized protein n=1 Tax=Microbacterium aurantiacum TaxID=162393 RepID=A0A0M8MIY4_9MICO|nr:hypothetical protein [Microbacterium chocolatum]ANG85323.1 hypothetical protein A8L33_07930 [Microbacterium chocolatum]KOS11057.1 hypothetical protein XI38_07230 [Microbacterium chocolatum]
MTSTPSLLIDLTGVARLAGVKRPVASMWRSRFRASPDPFPHVVQMKQGRPFFDAMSVAHWLDRTSHGNNPDVVADAAASAAPDGFDVADGVDVARIDALLTLQAVTGRSLAEESAASLVSLAAEIDPDDEFLAREVADVDPTWASWAEQLADAAYSPLAASRLLEQRHVATRATLGSAGPLTAEADELLLDLISALTAARSLTLAVNAGVRPGLAIDLLARAGDEDLELPAGPVGRSIRRRLRLEGMALPSRDSSADAGRISVLRLPVDGPTLAAHMLRAVDELVLGMRDDDRAVVVAPASALTAQLGAGDSLTRTDALRSGRVRAIVRLPAGLVPAATREALALWVLGRETGEAPVADRFTAVADLADSDLTPATRADLTSDVLAAMGTARDVRAHAFRFTRLVRTSSLLAARGDLLEVGGRTPAVGDSARELPALLDRARARLVDDVPRASPSEAPGRALPQASVEVLVAERHVRVLNGTRVATDELGRTGLVVVSADDLDDHARIGERRVDPLVFANLHPSARLTAPGDIVFRTAPTAKAWVDPDGSKVVASPARVLRIDPADPGGLVPELVAADISRSLGGPGSWRRWRLRRVAPNAMAPLRTALVDIAAQRAELESRIAALDHYVDTLTAAVTAGVVTLTDPAADAASDPQ